MELKGKGGRGKHQGLDHSVSGVRMGGNGEKEIRLTNVPEIDRKFPFTCSNDKYTCVCVCVCFSEPFVLLHLKRHSGSLDCALQLWGGCEIRVNARACVCVLKM